MPRRQDAKVRRTLVAALAASGLVLCAAPAPAQRLPKRLGPPAEWQVPAAAGAAAPRPPAAPSPRASAATRLSAARPGSGLTAGLFLAEVVTGAAGFAGGFYGGAVLGGRSCGAVGDCGGEDPGLGRAVVGALVGSWVGTAVLSHAGGDLAGGPTGSWGDRFAASAGGVLVALGVAAFSHPALDRPATLVGLPLIAAAVTALAVRRRP